MRPAGRAVLERQAGAAGAAGRGAEGLGAVHRLAGRFKMLHGMALPPGSSRQAMGSRAIGLPSETINSAASCPLPT